MMLASRVCRCSRWAGRDHGAWKEVTPPTPCFPKGLLSTWGGGRVGNGSHPPFLGRPSGEPSIPQGTVRPTGVGTQDNLPAQPPAKPGALDPSLAVTEPSRLVPDYMHEPHKAPT